MSQSSDGSTRRPKLGQHFLRSEAFCRKVADAVPFQSDDLVVEIGPGRGAITRLLASRARHLVAIELDSMLAQKLREDFQNEPRIEIIEGDILKAELREICHCYKADRLVVFGNLPYYITSPILHHLFTQRVFIRHMVLLVQQEVAERISAAPGTRDRGYLSLLAQCYSHPRTVLEIPPGAFSPPPKVYSALVSFQMISRFPSWNEATHTAFFNFAQSCFAQKRKNLINNLGQLFTRPRIQQALESLHLSVQVRAEQLTLEQFARLFEIMSGSKT